MSFRDNEIQRNSELSGSTSTSQEQFSERLTERLLSNSTPTRSENPAIFNNGHPSLPQHLQDPYHRNHYPMEHGEDSFGGTAQQMPSTGVLLSDEVISGSPTNGKKMS